MENIELKERFIDEKTGIEYIGQGYYYVPNLVLAPESTNYPIRRYGKLKLRYLKEHNKPLYSILFMNLKLNEYLHNIDEECEERMEILIKQMAEKENVTEELKANNQLEWVKCMNNIKNRAEEIILKEIIYNVNN